MKLGRGRTEQSPKVGTGSRVGRQGLSAYRQAHRAVGRQLGQWQDTVVAVDYTSDSERNRTASLARRLDSQLE